MSVLHGATAEFRRMRRFFGRRGRRGSEAAEFALVLPTLLLLMFGIVEGGRLLWTAGALHYAAEEAARCAAIDSALCGTESDVQAFAAAKAAGTGVAGSAFTWSSASCGSQVTATYSFTSLAPFVFPNPITITASACFPM